MDLSSSGREAGVRGTKAEDMPHREPDTDALLALYEEGDPTAGDRLFSRHRGRLKRMVAVHLDRRLVGRLDPSDVVQEALAEAAVRLPDYVAERPVPFYPWLRQIAWERLVRFHQHHLQAKRRSVTREEAWQPALPDDSVADLANRLVNHGTSPSVHALRKEVIRRVRDAIAELSPTDQELITLRYVEQLRVRDIAAILGTTEGAIKTRHFRVLARLHRLLSEET